VVTSWTGGGVIQGSGLMPAAQEANVHGFGWLPIADVGVGQAGPLNASQQRCLALYRSEGIVPRQYSDSFTMYTFCDAMFLYERALKATGGRSDGPSVAAAIERLGTTDTSVTTLGGLATFGPGRHDAPVMARPWGWDTSCGCFKYQGAEQPIS
jgi:hypothetical protein